MRRIFVDTGAWDAIVDGGEANHEQALAFRDEIAGKCKLVTPNYVLDELYTLLLMNVGYQQTIKFKTRLDTLIQEGILDVLWVTSDMAEEAWQVFEQFNTDKRWSFTDCVSYVAMKEHDLVEVFAFDRHFEQMGFIRLP